MSNPLECLEQNAVREVQQLIDNPETVAAMLLEMNKRSAPERKSHKKRNGRSRKNKSIKKKDQQSSSTESHRATNNLQDDRDSNFPYNVALQIKDSDKYSTKTVPTSTEMHAPEHDENR